VCRSGKLTNGHGCVHDNACESGRCSKWFKCEDKQSQWGTCGESQDCAEGICVFQGISGRCSDREIGSPCFVDENCFSGRCAKDFTCQQKLQNGQGCMVNDDCHTNLCVKGTVFRCSDKELNSPCWSDGDCVSGRCDGFMCRSKKPNGDLCWNDGDCTSNRCHWWRCKAPKPRTQYISSGNCADIDCSDYTESECKDLCNARVGIWEPNADDGNPAPDKCYKISSNGKCYFNKRTSAQDATTARHKLCKCTGSETEQELSETTFQVKQLDTNAFDLAKYVLSLVGLLSVIFGIKSQLFSKEEYHQIEDPVEIRY